MLDLDPDWDESALGFSKFSRFLRQAHDAEVINLRKIENGNYELTLPAADTAAAEPVTQRATEPEGQPRTGVGARRGSRTGRAAAPPPLLAGQIALSADAAKGIDAPGGGGAPFAPADLGLPVKAEAVVEYLTRAYRGIGRKSAESLIEAVGAERVFTTLATDVARIREILGDRRGETLIDAWQEDYRRRSGQRMDRMQAPPRTPVVLAAGYAPGSSPATDAPAEPKRSGGRRGRGRRGGRRRSGSPVAEPKND